MLDILRLALQGLGILPQHDPSFWTASDFLRETRICIYIIQDEWAWPIWLIIYGSYISQFNNKIIFSLIIWKLLGSYINEGSSQPLVVIIHMFWHDERQRLDWIQERTPRRHNF